MVQPNAAFGSASVIVSSRSPVAATDTIEA